MQLFFGWEAVGLVSYLLIGFWYTRPTAIVANMKAFWLTGSAILVSYSASWLVLHFGSLDYRPYSIKRLRSRRRRDLGSRL